MHHVQLNIPRSLLRSWTGLQLEVAAEAAMDDQTWKERGASNGGLVY